MTRVLIVDDHAVVRQGLSRILADQEGIEVGGEASTGRQAIQMGKLEAWDLVILDVSLPDGSGFEVLQELRHAKPDLPILVLSVHKETQYALRTLRAGAAGYLTKECAPDELVQAIRRVEKGGKYVSLDLAESLANVLAGEHEPIAHDALSDREFETLRMLGSGLSVSQIAEELAISPKTVSTYRRRILDKLGLETTAELIRYALEHDLTP
ncbi:MAG TPA: response regulator transcription factor [Anaerolineales bacterium]|jgi:two-component system invasion response regulator UvrY